MSRQLQLSIIVLLGTLGVLLTARIDHDGCQDEPDSVGYSSTEPPMFSVTYRRGMLSVVGHTASAEHEQQLDQIVADFFGEGDREITYRPHVLPPDHWQSATTRLLRALALTRSATATVASGGTEIVAVTSDGSAWSDALDSLRDVLPGNYTLAVDVIVQDAATMASALCGRVFADIVRTSVRFHQSSTEIRTSSYAVLDRLVNFTHDCRGAAISITGHSDSTGHDTYNQSLSLARAQAVADYLTRAGVESERLSVTGAGSSVPVADNSTPQGRSLNRRIEFELGRDSQ